MDLVLLETHFTQTVEAVAKAAGWTVDCKIVLAIASMFVASGNTFNGEKYNAIVKEMKKQSSYISKLRTSIGHSRPI